MPILTAALSIPFVAFLSLPLFFFAAFTTSIAFGTLLVRASVVYVELAFALIQSTLYPISAKPSSSKATKVQESKQVTRHGASKEAIRRKSSLTPLILPPVPHHVTNPNVSRMHSNSIIDTSSIPMPFPTTSVLPVTARDYEGVGGWDLPPLPSAASGPSNGLIDTRARQRSDASLMNARLELPALGTSPVLSRSRRRSAVGGHRSPDVRASPRMSRSPGVTRRSRRETIERDGSGSPEGYFGHVFTAGSGPTGLGVLPGSATSVIAGVTGVGIVESPSSMTKGVKSAETSRGTSRRSSGSSKLPVGHG